MCSCKPRRASQGAKKWTSTTSIALFGNISNPPQRRHVPLLSLFQSIAIYIKRSKIGASQVSISGCKILQQEPASPISFRFTTHIGVWILIRVNFCLLMANASWRSMGKQRYSLSWGISRFICLGDSSHHISAPPYTQSFLIYTVSSIMMRSQHPLFTLLLIS